MLTTENIIPHIPETVPINLDIGAEANAVPSTEDLYDDLELQRYKIDWLKRKEAILQLVNICKQSHQHKKIAKRLFQCGCFHRGYEIDGKLKIFNASHCKCRPCPVCQEYRQYLQTKRFNDRIDSLLKQYPDLIFIYVSVGYENVSIEHVVETNRRLHKGLALLFRKNKAFTIEGSVTFLHFVPSSTEIHFDSHSIIAVNPTVCEPKYFQDAFWAELFQKRFRLDYWPDVKAERIGLRTGNLKDELISTFSYGAGPLNFLVDQEPSSGIEESVTLSLIDGLAGSRSIISTGIFIERKPKESKNKKDLKRAKEEKLKPVMNIWMGEKMSITDLRKKNKTSTTRGN